jgi:hypothetical protein
MTVRQANGFEIDDENPMIPLKSFLKMMAIFEHYDPKAWVTMNERTSGTLFGNEGLGIPMYILANVGQDLEWGK